MGGCGVVCICVYLCLCQSVPVCAVHIACHSLCRALLSIL